MTILILQPGDLVQDWAKNLNAKKSKSKTFNEFIRITTIKLKFFFNLKESEKLTSSNDEKESTVTDKITENVIVDENLKDLQQMRSKSSLRTLNTGKNVPLVNVNSSAACSIQ
jgi:hypothetical protein